MCEVLARGCEVRSDLLSETSIALRLVNGF